MALAYISVGNTSNTTTQSYPAVVGAGELLFWCCSSKYDPNFVIPPADWTLFFRGTGGSGTGAGVGAATGAIYYKKALGTEGCTTFTVTATGVNTFFGRCVNFSVS
jgi:hypothetical protein